MSPGTVVLASSPLVGPLTMDTLADAIRVHDVPVITAAAPHALDDWLDALAIAAGPAVQPVVLVGFSAAGPRLPAAARRVHADALVFLDSRLPEDGATPTGGEPDFDALLDRLTDTDGVVAPWSQWWGDGLLAALIPDAALRQQFVAECPALPRSVFTAPVPAPEFAGPCGYVALSEGYPLSVSVARSRGWPVIELDGHHLWPLVRSDAVAGAVLDVAHRL